MTNNIVMTMGGVVTLLTIIAIIVKLLKIIFQTKSNCALCRKDIVLETKTEVEENLKKEFDNEIKVVERNYDKQFENLESKIFKIEKDYVSIAYLDAIIKRFEQSDKYNAEMLKKLEDKMENLTNSVLRVLNEK